MKTLAGAFGLAVGLGEMIAVSKEAVRGVEESINSQQRLQAVLKSTGVATGFSANQLIRMSESLMKVANVSGESIQDAMGRLAMFGSITGASFEKALKVSIDLSKMGFGSVENAARALGLAMESPTQGMMRLHRMGIMLTAGQQQYIKTLVDSGQQQKAQAMLLDIVGQKVSGVAEAMAKTPAGKLTAARIELSNLRKEMGRDLIPIFEKLVNLQISFQEFLNGAVKTTAQWIDSHKELVEIVAKLAAAYVGIKTTAAAIRWGGAVAGGIGSAIAGGARLFGTQTAAGSVTSMLATGAAEAIGGGAGAAAATAAMRRRSSTTAATWAENMTRMSRVGSKTVGMGQTMYGGFETVAASSGAEAMATGTGKAATYVEKIGVGLLGVKLAGISAIAGITAIAGGLAVVGYEIYDIWESFINMRDEAAKGEALDAAIEKVVEANKKMAAEQERAKKEAEAKNKAYWANPEEVMKDMQARRDQIAIQEENRRNPVTEAGEDKIKELKNALAAERKETGKSGALGVYGETVSAETLAQIDELKHKLKLTGIELTRTRDLTVELAKTKRMNWIDDLATSVQALEEEWTQADIAYQRYLENTPEATKGEKEQVRQLYRREENALVAKDLRDQEAALNDLRSGYDAIETQVQKYAREHKRATQEQIDLKRQQLREEQALTAEQKTRLDLVLKYRQAPQTQAERTAMAEKQREDAISMNERLRGPGGTSERDQRLREIDNKFQDGINQVASLFSKGLVTKEIAERRTAELQRERRQALSKDMLTGITTPMDYGKRIQEIFLKQGSDTIAEQQLAALDKISANLTDPDKGLPGVIKAVPKAGALKPP